MYLSLAILLYSVLTKSDYADWIDPIHLKELHTSYYDLLDHNHDKTITISEISLGILSQLETGTNSVTFIPEQYTCIPSLNFIDFADCISIAARQVLQTKIYMYPIDTSKSLTFEDMFAQYIGECTDISPNKDQFCHDLVESSPESCMMWSRTNQPYCKLSCYACEIEPTIFRKKSIRGSNGEYIPRREKLSTYYPPQEIRNQFAAAQNCTAVKADNHTGQILFISDIHVEPWYNVDGSGRVSRFKGADADNMFQCRNSKNDQVPCSLNGVSDPPYPLWKTGMYFLKDHAKPKDLTQTILIMGGDTQTHSYTANVSSPLTTTVADLMNKIVNEIMALLKADNVFYAAGNNDGQHDEIFCSGSDPAVNAAWAGVLIKNGIVNNALNRVYTYKNKTYNQISLFNGTGYYIKKIPGIFGNADENEAFYAIILNTNLGLNNELQNNLLSQDLAWIAKQNNGRVIVIGHHPNVTPDMIPKEYQSIVKGSFSGHVHYFKPTDSSGFAILPATTEAAVYAAVMTGDLNSKGDIVLTWDNFNQYLGAKHTLAQEDCWGYNGTPQ